MIASSRTKYSYRVTVTFKDGDKMDDIALRSSDIKTARDEAAYKIEQRWSDSKPTFEVRRISDAQCEAIIDAGGIDWATR